MKQKLLKTMVLALVMLGGASAAWAQQANSVTQPTGDTWVRTDNTGSNYGGSNTVEMQNNTNGTTDFYGVMQFTFDAPQAGYRVSSATLRLTTRFKKGDSKVNVYGLDAEVADDSNYRGLNEAITTALGTSPIASFKARGYNQWAPTDGAVVNDAAGESYRVVSAWQNNIDITSYVQGLSTNTFAILLEKEYSQNNSTQFFSKEATDIKLNDESATFAAADLVPQLTVTYEVDSDVLVSTTTSIADTWLRMNNNDSHAGNVSLEISSTIDGGVINKDFVGVMKFNFPNKPGYTIESASLRLVTDTRKGSTTMTIYPFADFNESDKYADHADDVAAARTAGAITNFTVKGLYNKQLSSSDAITDAFTSVDAWTNTIDITSYVKGLNSNTVSIMLENINNSPNKIFTKEAGTYTKTVNEVEYTFNAADLVPQLTVVYRKMSSYELNVSAAGAATLSLPFDATIPAGVTCYTLNYTAGNSAVKATEVTGGTLSANTPVLVNATAGNYEFTRTGNIVDASAVSGALTGVYTETIVPSGSYILYNGTDGIGFYGVDGSTNKVAAYRAYLTADGAGAKALTVDYDGSETGISETMKNTENEKKNNAVFDLSGRRVVKPTKGMYIVNGKKVVK